MQDFDKQGPAPLCFSVALLSSCRCHFISLSFPFSLPCVIHHTIHLLNFSLPRWSVPVLVTSVSTVTSDITLVFCTPLPIWVQDPLKVASLHLSLAPPPENSPSFLTWHLYYYIVWVLKFYYIIDEKHFLGPSICQP